MTKYTSEIFERLRKGQFICSNSPDEQEASLYKILENEADFEALYDYFEQINYTLESGNEYFYFSRKENKTDLDRKLKKAFTWIDLIDFFKTYDAAFGVGFRFTPAEITSQLNINADLKSKLENIKKSGSEKSKYRERIEEIVKILVNDNFVALESQLTETYKVLTSFHYLEELIQTINIPEDITNEIPE